MNSNQIVQLIKRRRAIQGMLWFSGSLLLTKGCASQANSSADLLPRTSSTSSGSQTVSSANGQVEFFTIYPGWYMGRTVHIYLKVHLDTNTVLTSQMYFPEQITRAVYTQKPYSDRTNRDTTNDQDFIMGDSEAVLINLSEEEKGYAGRLTIAVAR